MMTKRRHVTMLRSNLTRDLLRRLTNPSQLYSFCIVLWLPRNNLERFQYVVGFVLHLFTSPFVNIIVLIYSLMHSDDITWGKTREVVAERGSDDGDGLGRRGTH